MNTENQRDARTQSDTSAQREGGFGTPAPEEAPSTDAEIDEANASDAEDDGHRESFSSESDAEASGLPDAGSSD